MDTFGSEPVAVGAVANTADNVASYAESYLPEGVADLTGHGFAEPAQQDELIPVGEATEIELPVPTEVIETPAAPELTLVPKEGEAVATLAAENLSAYDKAMQETVTRVDDLSGLSLVPKEGGGAAQELDAQGDAMMALIENTLVSPGLGNELNPVEQPSTSVKVSAPSEKANAAPAAAAEQAPDKKEIDKDILGLYQERFGINPEELKGIAEFNK